ncbi:MAG: PAS domain-containing protein [Rhodocyclaceae bacterium]|nr:PAS domain-containing protein [Rhodocyclaceae bacterium]
MRINQPVTDREVFLEEGVPIVSRTDLRGVITYVNEAFVAISGFTEAELVGTAHNLVRHPDMPPAAFEDLWSTLKTGKPWMGLVKNRCKNGDFYWVVANVTPVRENGQVVGYLSVRTRPSRDQVAHASALYRSVAEGSRPLRPRPSFARRVANLPLAHRLYGLIAVMLAVALASVLLGGGGAMRLAQQMQTLFDDRFDHIIELSEMQRHMAQLHAGAYAAAQTGDPGSRAVLVEAAADRLARIEVLVRACDDHCQRTSATQAFHGMHEAWERFRPAVERVFRMAAEGADSAMLMRAAADLKEPYALLDERAWNMSRAQDRLGRALFAEAQQLKDWIRNALLAAFILMALVAVFASRAIVRSVIAPLREANQVFRRIGEGHYDNVVSEHGSDEVGMLFNELMAMQIRLGFDVSEARRIASEALRVKVALDCVETNVRIATPAGQVLYANRALQDTLRRIETRIAESVPGFSADTFVGSDITRFYADPEQARLRLAGLSTPLRSMMLIGGREFEVVTSPIVDERGKSLGSVGEWRDRTDELAAQRAVQQAVEAAASGDFSARLAHSGSGDFLQQLTTHINRLIEAADRGLQEANGVLGAMAEGDLTRRIEGDYEGAFGELKEYTNRTADALTRMIGEIAEAAGSVSTAAQQIAKGNQDLSSRTEEQASSLEQTASSMEELTSAVRQNADNAQQARQLAVAASGVAGKGAEAVQQMVGTMDDIHQAARKIVDIISVIDGIAFQTNILALNAAVEAARAGEQGRGFAVVASEVRSLAQRSAAAAKEIKTLISDSVDKVEQGSALMTETGGVIREVVTSVRQVTDVVSEISAASAEQSGGIEQVNTAITHMDEVTQQNAALVEQASAAAESLEEQAHALSQSVSVFRIGQQEAGSHQPSLPKGRSSHEPEVKRAPAKAGRSKPAQHDDEDEWRDF